MNMQQLECSNPDCDFTSSGKCVEGYATGECPHGTSISLDDIPEADEPSISSAQPEPAIVLASGEALDRAQTSLMQRRRTSKSIGVIGPNDSGKTSMIAGVYDLLQEGPISGASFAGSATLVGFEKVCHLARAVSRRVVPHTERTSRGADATFFHLDLRHERAELTSLFISDRSGEDYLSVTDQISQANEFFEIRRADCVTLLVDGAQLADSRQRHEVRAASPQIVEAMIEAKAIRKGCRLAVVLTKKDAVVASAHAQRVRSDFAELVNSITVSHSAHLGEVRSFEIAASPKDCEQVSRGEGVAELLQFWLLPNAPMVLSVSDEVPRFERMIDLLRIEGSEN